MLSHDQIGGLRHVRGTLLLVLGVAAGIAACLWNPMNWWTFAIGLAAGAGMHRLYSIRRFRRYYVEIVGRGFLIATAAVLLWRFSTGVAWISGTLVAFSLLRWSTRASDDPAWREFPLGDDSESGMESNVNNDRRGIMGTSSKNEWRSER